MKVRGGGNGVPRKSQQAKDNLSHVSHMRKTGEIPPELVPGALWLEIKESGKNCRTSGISETGATSLVSLDLSRHTWCVSPQNRRRSYTRERPPPVAWSSVQIRQLFADIIRCNSTPDNGQPKAAVHMSRVGGNGTPLLQSSSGGSCLEVGYVGRQRAGDSHFFGAPRACNTRRGFIKQAAARGFVPYSIVVGTSSSQVSDTSLADHSESRQSADRRRNRGRGTGEEREGDPSRAKSIFDCVELNAKKMSCTAGASVAIGWLLRKSTNARPICDTTGHESSGENWRDVPTVHHRAKTMHPEVHGFSQSLEKSETERNSEADQFTQLRLRQTPENSCRNEPALPSAPPSLLVIRFDWPRASFRSPSHRFLAYPSTRVMAKAAGATPLEINTGGCHCSQVAALFPPLTRRPASVDDTSSVLRLASPRLWGSEKYFTAKRNCSPPTKADRDRFPAGQLQDFHLWKSCRTMPLVGGLPRGSPVSPRPCIPALLHTHLASPSSAFKTSMNLWHYVTHKLHYLPKSNWARAHNVYPVVVTPLESRRATSCSYNSNHPVWHALYECFQEMHGDSSPFLLQLFHELSNGFWPRLTSPHPEIQFVPNMFYRVYVGALSGPVQSANIVVGVPLHSSP
ncbi:hypothetical protein PR048_022341 [Dryococelus australis]|uniref:Uncharacterized protein n=1 Tax=Dryococelus australis TaxID=614101 RepID=A0ABQ9H0V9_9NEOP|nr:hypothetical protein PR048_022341 [Dryococelus australis]